MGVFFTRRGAAPKLGKRASDYAVGESVFLLENGAAVEYLVVHQGMPSILYDSSCDGTWLLRKNIYANLQWNGSNINDYANSTIHRYLNSTFLGLFDANVKAAIEQVKIQYRPGSGNDKTVTSGVSGLLTKIFLLSGTEVSLAHSFIPVMGTELDYFKGCQDSAEDTRRVAYLNGSASNWWLRCPDCNPNNGSNYSSALALAVYRTGFWVSPGCAVYDGIRPALVINSGTRFDPDTNIFKEAA